MKQMILGILTAILMVAGLAVVEAPSASAACPYQGCVSTKTSLKGPVTFRKGTTGLYSASVKSRRSNLKPKGTFVFKVTGLGNRKNFFYKQKKDVNNGTKFFRTPRMPRGKYVIKLRFIKKNNSAFYNSGDAIRIRVR